MYIFYDTETTGTNVAFDQVLQFAAVLTNESLQELERFEIRCRILPWVVPSPLALLATNTSPRTLDDSRLPTFFDMMRAIRKKLEAWRPATFIGYNSMKFDEPILQRAFWQALQPPYQTVTNGNARSDLLPLVRALSYFTPTVLNWPTGEDGKMTFRLDRLAPFNGFNHLNAHDALGDVEAAIFIAKQVMERAPDIWNTLISRAPKTATNSVLTHGRPVFVFEHIAGQPSLWAGQRVDREGGRASHASVARLNHDWKLTIEQLAKGRSDATDAARKPVRYLPLNKSPIVFTTDEVEKLFGIVLDPVQKTQAEYLISTKDISEVVESYLRLQFQTEEKSKELEERIFEGYSSRPDEALMAQFQDAEWLERAKIARAFEDHRLRNLALRIIFVSAPEALFASEVERMEKGISHRLFANNQASRLWRTLPDAIEELSTNTAQLAASDVQISEMREWLNAKSAYRH
jgi:exodeoxyribonuclease-1